MALPKLDVQKHNLKVPSTGAQVQFRAFTVKEQKVLMMAKESEDSAEMLNAARELIKVCTMGEVDTTKLTTFDFEYIFLQIRAKSVGETSDVLITCTSCDHQNEVQLQLDKVTVVGEVLDEKARKVMLTDDIGVVLQYPFIDALSKAMHKKKTESNKIIATIVASIESIFDSESVYPSSDSTQKELEEFVEQLTPSQINAVNTLFDTMPAVAIEQEFTCVKCKELNKTEIKGLNNFF